MAQSSFSNDKGLKNKLQSKDPDKGPEFMRMTSLVDFDGRVVAKKLDFSTDSPGSKSMSSSVTLGWIAYFLPFVYWSSKDEAL